MANAQEVKSLRDRTGVGMMACKKALEEANGDIDKAIEILRKRGESKAAEKADRSTGEGCVAYEKKAIIKLLCETDFVAKNQDFIDFAQAIASEVEKGGKEAGEKYFEEHKTNKIQEIGENIVLGDIQVLEQGQVGGYVHSNLKIGALVALDGGESELARELAMHVTAMSPLVLAPEDMDQDLINKEKEIAKEQLLAEGKPENIIENIISGKIKKFCEEKALITQPFVKDPSLKVQDYAGDTKVLGFLRFEV